jgi:minor structural protein GP20
MSQPAGGAQSGAPDPTQSGGDPNQTGTQPPAAQPPADPAAQSGAPAGTPDPTATTVSRAEFEALQARMVAADRRAAIAEKKIKDAEDAQLSEADRVKKQLEEAEAKLKAEKERNDRQTVDNAILADQTYSGKWHNVQTAMGLIDRSGITIEDNGSVTGVKAALDKLAKDHAYLLKPVDAGTGTNNGGGTTGAPGTSRQTGAKPGQEEWERNFPAMRGRVPRASGS